MEEFKIWFSVGFDHILNIQALDHILFILALVVIYKPSRIKQIVLLITAFTVGHSITLIISALELISYDQKIIEFAIPLTIVITSINNIISRKQEQSKSVGLNYFIALVFGLIHGLGFANYLKALLFKGNIILELFSFNVGIEVAQLVVVSVFLIISYLGSNYLFRKRENWVLFVSSAIFGISLMLTLNAKFW
ncbi:MAG: HupE/UreJ family protein [Bacteroidota bacterium]|nr:HupE/UreJ family protein [Bacteroidota bacterium]|tara:strand:+ start:3209 stop:3787 length:579 start_codon:yes stop_codon:yes gene_type:complete